MNDEPLGRVLDKLYDPGLTEIFIRVPLSAADRFGVKMDSFHLDSSSFHVHGDYGTGTDDEASAQSSVRSGAGFYSFLVLPVLNIIFFAN
ncbi:hypothetical protein RintRC_6515 [Richelia intracellularis]|nr:hypothetical protein RintRC_6515 [Richelia intracellularis]